MIMIRRALEDVAVGFGLVMATVISDDVIATVQLVFNMILGVLLLILRIIKLVKDAKKDGKITEEEKEHILDEVSNGVTHLVSGNSVSPIYSETDSKFESPFPVKKNEEQ